MPTLVAWIQRHFYEVQMGLGVVFGIGFFLAWRNLRSNDGPFFKPRTQRTQPLAPESTASEAPSDAHQVLGLRGDATENDVIKAFRGLMKRYHPDHAPNQNSQAEYKAQSQKIISAKDTLLQQLKAKKRR